MSAWVAVITVGVDNTFFLWHTTFGSILRITNLAIVPSVRAGILGQAVCIKLAQIGFASIGVGVTNRSVFRRRTVRILFADMGAACVWY